MSNASPEQLELTDKAYAQLSYEAQIVLSELAQRRQNRQAIIEGARPAEPIHYGVPSGWRSLGPFSNYDASGFPIAYPPEEDERFAALYRWRNRDLKPVKAHALETIERVVESGVYYYESYVEVAQSGPYLLALTSDSSSTLWLDNEAALRRDALALSPPYYLARLVELEAGRHRLLFKHAGRSSNVVSIRLIPVGQAPQYAMKMSEAGELADADLLGHIRYQGGLPATIEEMAQSPFLLWLAADYAGKVGDHARARHAIGGVVEQYPFFLPAMLTNAELFRSDPGLDPALATSYAIEELRDLLAKAPELNYAALLLGAILLDEGQRDAALEQFDGFVAQVPNESLGHDYRHRALEEKGWVEPAREALRRAAQLAPDDCRLAYYVVTEEIKEGHYPVPAELSESQQACPGIVEALVEHYYLPREQLKEAVHAYESLLGRYPYELSYLLRLAELAIVAGEYEQALALYTDAEAFFPEEDQPLFVFERVDLLVSLERQDEAAALVNRAIEANPSSIAYIRLAQQFEQPEVLADLRVDGLAYVQEYLANTRNEAQHSAFLILDYAAFRYFPDGTGLSVTHQITRVLNKEGKNQHGEVYIPPGAVITQLRTIKADGVTTIEPETIPNKPSVSMPNLEVGDFIEFEYIVSEPARVEDALSFSLLRWYFQIYDAPLMYSKVVYEFPKGIEPQLEVRGEVPPPEITENGDFTRYTYLMTDMLQPRPEPFAPSMLEIVPSVRVAYDVQLNDRHAAIRNGVIKSVLPSAYLADALLLAIGDEQDPEAIARRAFHFVKSEVAEESDTYFGMPASWVWTRRAGSRFSLLKALLDMAGVHNYVVLIRPFGAPEVDGPIPDLEYYSEVALFVELDDGSRLWLDPTQTHAKFNYLSSTLQGQPAYTLEAEPRHIVVDTFPVDYELQQLAFELQIEEDGRLVGTATETSDGENGTGLKNFISRSQLDDDEVRDQLANYLASSFGEVSVSDYSFSEITDDEPVSVSFAFEAQRFGRLLDNQLEIQCAIFNDQLMGQFAFLPRRTQPLLLGLPIHNVKSYVFEAPAGQGFVTVPESLSLDTPMGSYTLDVELSDEGVLEIRERLDLPAQRIQPEDYQAFREFAAQVDEAQKMRIVVAP